MYAFLLGSFSIGIFQILQIKTAMVLFTVEQTNANGNNTKEVILVLTLKQPPKKLPEKRACVDGTTSD